MEFEKLQSLRFTGSAGSFLDTQHSQNDHMLPQD